MNLLVITIDCICSFNFRVNNMATYGEAMVMGSPVSSPSSPGAHGVTPQSPYLPSYLMGDPAPITSPVQVITTTSWNVTGRVHESVYCGNVPAHTEAKCNGLIIYGVVNQHLVIVTVTVNYVSLEYVSGLYFRQQFTFYCGKCLLFSLWHYQ